MTASNKPAPARRGPMVDFKSPNGEPALYAPDSVSWKVYKNPIALYIGGITAVLLEFVDPKIRSGVWDHSSFRVDPIPRLRRTGLASMVTVYAAKSSAERMIAGVTRMHQRVVGETEDGDAYEALDPDLMNWVQATASFGFMQAYHQFVEPLTAEERDAFYLEAVPSAQLFGAPGSPRSEADWDAQLQARLPRFSDHPTAHEFLAIMRKTKSLPLWLQPLNGLLIQASIELLPAEVRKLLKLDKSDRLGTTGRMMVKTLGKIGNHLRSSNSPAVQACQRLGLPGNYLYQ